MFTIVPRTHVSVARREECLLFVFSQRSRKKPTTMKELARTNSHQQLRQSNSKQRQHQQDQKETWRKNCSQCKGRCNCRGSLLFLIFRRVLSQIPSSVSESWEESREETSVGHLRYRYEFRNGRSCRNHLLMRELNIKYLLMNQQLPQDLSFLIMQIMLLAYESNICWVGKVFFLYIFCPFLYFWYYG